MRKRIIVKTSKSPHSTAVLSKVSYVPLPSICGNWVRRCCTSSQTIFFVLKSIWPGSERGGSVLREPNPSSLDRFCTRTTPEWNCMEPDTSLWVSCIITAGKTKTKTDGAFSEKKLLFAWN